MEQVISEKRQKLIDELNASPLKESEEVMVKHNAVTDFLSTKKADCIERCIILKVGKKIKVRYWDNSVHKKEYDISPSDIVSRNLRIIGENPFVETQGDVRTVAFTFESILFNLNILGEKGNTIDKYKMGNIQIEELNWNPFIYNKDGQKEYYQRPFVWTLKDKQLLVESIYQGIDCGKILVRKRGWDELEQMYKKGETELAFQDIVDGKQRLDAVRGFIMGEFADSNGNYWGDLSFEAQGKFIGHQLFSYAEMPAFSKDEDVIRQFLKMNFTGVPQSESHIKFVKSLQNKI